MMMMVIVLVLVDDIQEMLGRLVMMLLQLMMIDIMIVAISW